MSRLALSIIALVVGGILSWVALRPDSAKSAVSLLGSGTVSIARGGMGMAPIEQELTLETRLVHPEFLFRNESEFFELRMSVTRFKETAFPGTEQEEVLRDLKQLPDDEPSPFETGRLRATLNCADAEIDPRTALTLTQDGTALWSVSPGDLWVMRGQVRIDEKEGSEDRNSLLEPPRRSLKFDQLRTFDVPVKSRLFTVPNSITFLATFFAPVLTIDFFFRLWSRRRAKAKSTGNKAS